MIEYRLWYHGTNKENSEIILKKGFKSGTYFARHLEDALGFGGRYVFEVAFKMKKKDYWEYKSHKQVPPKKIVRLRYYPPDKLLYHDEMLGDKVFQYNLQDTIEQNKI